MPIANPRYADPTNMLVDVDYTFDEETANQYHAAGDTVRYTYDANDTSPVTNAIRALLAAGSYTIAAYVAPPPPVPSSVTRRQLLIGLTQAGLITAAEGIAAAQSGAVPAAIQTYFNTLATDAEHTAAEITWAAMSVAERGNSLVAGLAAIQNLSSGQVDDLFRAWALL